MGTELTDRQRREVEYHREHAAVIVRSPTVSYKVITSRSRQWWNAYWSIWSYLLKIDLTGKRILVVGCGAGEDSLYFAKLGAIVSAFDLSPEMLTIARSRATTEHLSVQFDEMPAEAMTYESGTFDIVFCRDILHHVDIAKTMAEIVRVSKPGATFIADEIYSHSLTDLIRHSRFVERVLYPLMKGVVYRDKFQYITADERKMTERDIALVRSYLQKRLCYHTYFNFLVTRIFHDGTILDVADRIILKILGPLGHYVGGRILLVGRRP